MLLEVCVDSYESSLAAQRGGADRLELCGDLLVGGITPSPFLIEKVQKLDMPVNVLLRPRFGDFLYTETEKDILFQEVQMCRKMGVNGVVLGALEPNGHLDKSFLQDLITEAGPLHKTLHRAFDVCVDAEEGLYDAIELGFDTILSSGQAATALQGASMLAQLHQKANDRITIMAGSGVKASNLSDLMTMTGLTAFHMSAKCSADSPMVFRRKEVPMGLPMAGEYERFYTDEAEVRKAKSILCKK